MIADDALSLGEGQRSERQYDSDVLSETSVYSSFVSDLLEAVAVMCDAAI